MLKNRFAVMMVVLVGVFVLIGVSIGYFVSSLSELPRVGEFESYNPNQITTVYSDDGQIIGEFFVERREVVPLSRIPASLRDAFVGVEDHRFYDHPGIDVIRLAGAFWSAVSGWRRAAGTSTITQQLARNLFLTHERTISRKLREMALAIEIERRYSKDEILKMYLNQIYFGHGVYGVAEAASFYFGKQLQELTIADSALLAAIPKGPGLYSPFYNEDNALRRRNHVLERMYEVGFIDESELHSSLELPLNVVRNQAGEGKGLVSIGPYFVEWVRRIIQEKYGDELLWKGGLKIYTTLDSSAQQAAENALVPYLEENDFQGALLAMNPATGYVKAMVGGRSYQESQWNRATQAHRQTGSAFKLFTYTAAIDRGQFNAVSPFFDGPVVYFTGKRTADERFWSPENYEKYYWGDVFLWEMLAHSINVASVKLLEKVGVNVTIDYARRMGVASSLARDLTLTLGTSGVTLLEMVNAYGTIANYGVYVKPVFITRVETATGELLEQSYFEGERVLSPQTAFVMIDLLTKVVERGTGRRIRWLGFERPCGGKTGTVGWTGEKDTDKTMDAWFLGFTPELVAGVWIGKDDASPLGPRLTGSSAAIPAWTSFMKQALADVPVKDFPSPSGVVFKEIDLETGLLAHEEDGGETDWFAFIEGTAPELYRSESGKANYRIWERLSPYPTPQN